MYASDGKQVSTQGPKGFIDVRYTALGVSPSSRMQKELKDALGKESSREDPAVIFGEQVTDQNVDRLRYDIWFNPNPGP